MGLIVAADAKDDAKKELEKLQGKFTVDPSKSPKTIDVTITEGDNKDKTMKGIYEIDGDNYKVCYAPFGKDRPKEFSSKGEEGLVLSVWKRDKK